MMDHAEAFPTELEISRIVLNSLLEILGPDDLDSILTNFPVSWDMDEDNLDVSSILPREIWVKLHKNLLAQFGSVGTAGLAIRTGQVLFKNFIYGFGHASFLDDREYRMLPKPARIRRGLEGLAELQEKYVTGSHAIIDHDQENWYWKLEPLEGWTEYPQMQDLLVKVVWGMIIEFVSWTGGGKVYPVHETEWSDSAIRERVIVIRKKYVD